MRRYSFDDNRVPARAGCALVFPAAVLGTIGLADFSGPGGWRGLAEFIGWWALSIAVAIVIARLFSVFASDRRRQVSTALAIAAIAIGFTIFTYLTGAPETPLRFKQLFTGFLQVVGLTSFAALIAFLAYSSGRAFRS